MGVDTTIAFAHHTWSPWRGCEHAVLSDGTDHPGCFNCYAEAMAKRNPQVLGEWGPDGARPIGAEAYLTLPSKWNQAAKEAGERRRVFPSLMDPFENRPDLYDVRHFLFKTIDGCPDLDFLLFTKRANWVLEFWEGGYRPNVWLVYSASDQPSLTDGIHHLLLCRDLVPVLGLSLEPLLGPVDLTRFYLTDKCGGRYPFPNSEHEFRTKWIDLLDWVVVGGESGPHRRDCAVSDITSVVDQCQAAGVPCFVKQDGAPRPGQQGRIPDDYWKVKELPR
jgi:protein gp37